MIILRKSLIQEEKGLTLMEVLVAVFILAVVLTPMIACFGRNLNKVAEVRNASIALNLAKEGMERVRSGELSECPASYETTINETTWQITYECSDLGTSLMKVTVKVFNDPASDPLAELVSLVETL